MHGKNYLVIYLNLISAIAIQIRDLYGIFFKF